MDYCRLLASFTHSRQPISPSDIAECLHSLMKNGAVINAFIEGYLQCSLCQNSTKGSRTAELECKHQVHFNCLKKEALRLTDGTLDPGLLMKLCCKTCLRRIDYHYFSEMVTARWIEQRMAEVTKREVQKLQLEQRRERQKKLDEKEYDCGVCGEPVKIDMMVTFDCDHRFCKNCSANHIRTKLGQGKYEQADIGCLECGEGFMTEQMLRYCVGPEMTMRIINFRHKNLKVPGLNIMTCKGFLVKRGQEYLRLLEPTPNMTPEEQKKFEERLEGLCRSIIRHEKPAEIGEVQECPGLISHHDDDEGHQIVCKVCLLKQCVHGCQVTHEGRTCEQYRESVKDSDLDDNALQQLRQAGLNVVKCPNPRCQALINRISGCDWVQCRCRCQLCYICKMPWTGTCRHKNGHPPFDFEKFLREQR